MADQNPYAAYGGSVATDAQAAPAPTTPIAAHDPYAAYGGSVATQSKPAQPTQQAQPEQDKGVLASVKRNTVDALTGLYRAFTDPATDQEKQDLLQKVREGNEMGKQIPESLATNPSRATLALHRLI